MILHKSKDLSSKNCCNVLQKGLACALCVVMSSQNCFSALPLLADKFNVLPQKMSDKAVGLSDDDLSQKEEEEAEKYVSDAAKEFVEIISANGDSDSESASVSVFNKISDNVEDTFKKLENSEFGEDEVKEFKDAMNSIKKDAEDTLNDESLTVEFQKTSKLAQLWFKAKILADEFFSVIKSEVVAKIVVKAKTFLEKFETTMKLEFTEFKSDLKDLNKEIRKKFVKFVNDYSFTLPSNLTVNVLTLNGLKVL